MQIGIVSDTHGHMLFSKQAVAALRKYDLEAVIHCGDIGGPEIVALFKEWPTHFVYGNVDHYLEGLLDRTITAAGQTCHGVFGSVELEGKKIAFLHSDDNHRLHTTIASQEWDLVCYGHTHVAEHHLEDRTLVLNPGAVYRANPRSIAIVTLPTLDVESVILG
jgi:uncharacterized protein